MTRKDPLEFKELAVAITRARNPADITRALGYEGVTTFGGAWSAASEHPSVYIQELAFSTLITLTGVSTKK